MFLWWNLTLLSTTKVIKVPWGLRFYVHCPNVVEQPTVWYTDDHESINFWNETENIFIFPRFYITRFLIFNCIYLFLELSLLFLEVYEVQSWLGF